MSKHNQYLWALHTFRNRIFFKIILPKEKCESTLKQYAATLRAATWKQNLSPLSLTTICIHLLK